MSKSIEVRMNELDDWIRKLSPLDRENFLILVSLDSAPAIVANMPKGEYRSMATTALAIGQALRPEE